MRRRVGEITNIGVPAVLPTTRDQSQDKVRAIFTLVDGRGNFVYRGQHSSVKFEMACTTILAPESPGALPPVTHTYHVVMTMIIYFLEDLLTRCIFYTTDRWQPSVCGIKYTS